MQKRIIIALIIILVLTTPVFAKWSKKGSTNQHPDASFAIWVDEETGVEYVLTYWGYGGGICPRYNADGTLYTSGEE